MTPAELAAVREVVASTPSAEQVAAKAYTLPSTSSDLSGVMADSLSPEDISSAYNIIAQDVQNRAATEASRIGNAQRSLGTLAGRVGTPSGMTSGLANYTYNRVMRPAVNTLASNLVTAGYAGTLENDLSNQLRAAKNRYEDAKNAYTVAASGGGTKGNNGVNFKDPQTYDPGMEDPESVSKSTADRLKQFSQLSGLAYRGDIQQKLYEEWKNGNLDTSDFVAEYWFVENDPNYLPGYHKYNKSAGTWNN